MQNKQRFRSLSEIEKYHSSDPRNHFHFNYDSAFEYRYRKMREFTSKPFKFDLKSSNGLHMSGNGAISSSNLEIHDTITQPNSGTLSKKTRDFIGENLIDIENTLKALNLDFLQTFSELEKNDSAETLFGENYAYESNINPKIFSTALKLTKLPQNYGCVDASPKSAKNSSQLSPPEKQMAQNPFSGMQYLNDSSSNDKLLDGKRSSTPDTGFASRETTTSSRRGSQKSSYSPQDSHYSPIYGTQTDDTRNTVMTNVPTAIYSKINNVPFPNRQRSMSFTENYEINSPVLSEPQAKINFPSTMSSSAYSKLEDNTPMLRTHTRRSFGCKPKSIRARNLRRMSYNPIFLESSSSSNSENEFDHHGIAQSELDIRAKLFPNKHRPNNIQYLQRKSSQFQSNSSTFAPSPDKLYGSNASIKSAPHYNYSSDRQLHQYFDQKFRMRSCDVDESQPSNNPFERSSRGSSRRRQQRSNYVLPPPPPPPPTAAYNTSAATTGGSGAVSAINFDMYSQFDVTKLTGKSPTTQTFMQELFTETKNCVAGTPTRQKQSPLQSKSAFQWPEKIHVSAVQMNNSLWSTKNTTPPSTKRNGNTLIVAKTGSLRNFTSDSSSSTETDLQTTNEFNPINPPSPAHE